MATISRISLPKVASQLLLFILFAAPCTACTCASHPTTCESLATAKVVFIGTVTRGTEADNTTEPGQGFGSRPAIVRVETIVRGLPQDVQEIKVNSGVLTSCYYELKAGERWLITGALSRTGLVYSGVCAGSREIRPGDTEITRMVASYLGGPNLFVGSVRLYKGWDSKWRDDNLLPEVDVKLTGKSRKWSARTGATGRFGVEDLPAGEYQFTVSKPGLSAEMASSSLLRSGKEVDRIMMPEHGCVEAPVLMWPDSKISGTVRGTDGLPINGITVAAYSLDEGNRLQFARSAITDKYGDYVILRLLTGRYAVGTESRTNSDEEYPVSFHPSGSGREAAIPISIADGTSAEGVDIVVPPRRKAVIVQVRVLWPDGRPVLMAGVSGNHAEEGTIFAGDHRDLRSGFTDADGFVTIRLYEGTEYTLVANWQRMEQKSGRTVAWHYSNEVKLIAAPEETVTLTMNENPEPRGFR